jgi:hypothetical protein
MNARREERKAEAEEVEYDGILEQTSSTENDDEAFAKNLDKEINAPSN